MTPVLWRRFLLADFAHAILFGVMNVYQMACEDLPGSAVALPHVFVFFLVSVVDFNVPLGEFCGCVVEVVERG